MPAKILAKGNTITELKNFDCSKVIGYKILTGPEGEETLDDSYCGTREIQIREKPGTKLVKVDKQHSCTGMTGLKFGQIVEITEDPAAHACDAP